MEGYKAVVIRLLAAGVSINMRDDLLLPAWHNAMLYGHREIVELLLDKGADTTPVNGATPLHSICRSSDPGMVMMLIDRGFGK